MNKIKSEWDEVIGKYGDKDTFKFWSSKIKGKGDETLEKGVSLKKWTKVIILNPKGEPDTTFLIGYVPYFGDITVARVTRRIYRGPFGMRMGPEDCEFFIVSNHKEVELEFVRYAPIGESGIDLY